MNHKAEKPFGHVMDRARAIVAQMTLEEKASMCSGRDFWHTQDIERLGIPAVMVTDGPNGLRKQAAKADHLGLNQSVPATCFPTAAATTCSFDPDLLRDVGRAIGEETRAEGVGAVLGPAINIKRSPLCGRNFEYASEDPLLAGELAAAFINGVQENNVGTSLKHYLANSQEKARLVSNSVIDERALREIYMTAFEIAVKKSQPWTMMCSYNRINGEYAADSVRLMHDIPRNEWDFGGYIMSDWGAVNDCVQCVRADVALEMPGVGDSSAHRIAAAVRAGELDETLLDRCAAEVTAFALCVADNTPDPYDKEAHNELARRAARESAVLLRRGATLPVRAGSRIAVIGDFAKNPRFQGAGSGRINPIKVTSLCDAFDARGVEYVYAKGYESEQAEPDQALIDQAVEAVRDADVVIACVGLPDSFESEGFDREHLEIPESQNELVKALTKVNPNVVAVVSAGAPAILPWRESVDSILLMYLGGQNSGSAAADLLLGDVCPSGKLAETWPLCLEDTPCFGRFGATDNVEYRESIYVGYRYYDKAKKDVQYPFGFGLSYTDFAYSDLSLDKAELGREDTLNVGVTVTNTGAVAGAEIVELYVSFRDTGVFRPVRELRAFRKVFLQPGESRRVSMELDRRAFAYYNVDASAWTVEEGEYAVEIGASSRDIRLSASVSVAGDDCAASDLRAAAPVYFELPSGVFDVPAGQFEAVLGAPLPSEKPLRPFTRNTTLGALRASGAGGDMIDQLYRRMEAMFESSPMMLAMLEDMPVRQISMMVPDFTPDKIDEFLSELNEKG